MTIKKTKPKVNPLTCPKCKRSFSGLFYLKTHYCTKIPWNKLPPWKPKDGK